ncbi:MAG: hypothetical protein M3N34_03155 [Pseudomonadota bacterium]|nr:hypothetical protein [Pseudomonadota bacterium]
MKAKIGGIDVEGTPEEILTFSRMIENAATPPAVPPLNKAAGDERFVSEEVAFKVIKRRPLSPGQSTVLALLLRNSGTWTTAKDLQKATKYEPSQLAGLLGAFGKRVSSTDGYVEGTAFFEVEWDYEKDCHKYRLPSGPLAAVERVKP